MTECMYAGLITNPMTPSDLQIPQKSPKHFAKNLTSPIIPIHLYIQAMNLLRMLEFAFSLLDILFETFQIKSGSKGISS